MRVTGIVHARNSELTLDRALRSLAWAGELIVVDMGSGDATREIAARLGARILSAPEAPRVDGIRNRYLGEARHEWIFVLDADEYLADDAARSVEQLLAEQAASFDAFAIPRFNRFGEQILRGSAWYPDHQIRLFRRGTVEWGDTTHRPPRVSTGAHRLCHLQPPDCLHIHHRNYEDLLDFIRRQVSYALNDSYATDPAEFDFDQAVARAYRSLAARRDVASDGELSHALALLMAWDEIIRALVHWERLGRPRPLGQAVALPIATAVLDPRQAWRRSWRVRAAARLRAALARHPRLAALLRSMRARVARGADG